MLQIRIEIIVLLCDIVLAGSGVALLATGCQSQRGGGLRPVPPPLNTPLLVSLSKTAEPMEMTFGLMTRVGPGPCIG